MANFKNTDYDYIITKRTVPESANGTGTITTSGIAVVGVGTQFLSEMPVGSWITDITNDEIRKVIRVNSNTEAVLDYAFTTNLASAAPDIIIASKLNISALSVKIPTGSPNGEIDGKVFIAGESATWTKDGRSTSSLRDFVDPIIVDGAGTIIMALTLK